MPSGHIFVVTSLQYAVRLVEPGRIVDLNLRRGRDSITNSNLALSAFEIADDSGRAAGRQTMPTGIAFGPGVEPCIEATGQGGPGIVRASMQGYLKAR